MKVFVSSSRTNREMARTVMNWFIERGAEITHDWTDAVPPTARYLDAEMEALEERLRYGISICELYVLLLPGGINSHVELGMALAWGKEVWVVTTTEFSKAEDDPAACAFYWNPRVRRIEWPAGELLTPKWVQTHTRSEQRQYRRGFYEVKGQTDAKNAE